MLCVVVLPVGRSVVLVSRRVCLLRKRSVLESEEGIMLKKTYKRGGSTVIWKCSWGYKIAPQNKNNSKLKKQKETKVECTVHTPKSGLRIVLR